MLKKINFRVIVGLICIEIIVCGFLFAVLSEHPYLKAKDKGACQDLTGDVLLTVVFLEDTVSSWNDEEMEKMRTNVESGVHLILEESKRYSVDLRIDVSYQMLQLEDEATWETNWEASALKRLGFSAPNYASEKIAYEHNVKEAPILFLINKKDRSYARQNVLNQTEYSVMYRPSPSTVAHELYHLFGAEDYYYPESVRQTANEMLPQSIMNSGTEVDALTAYLIGWTDTMTRDAKSFLRETRFLSDKKLKEENQTEVFTGYLERENESGAYSGEWLHGMYHGNGKKTYADGSIYDGTWAYGVYDGYGVYTDASGNVYEGEWKSGVHQGYGAFTFSQSGDRYEGDFSQGKIHGYGTYFWSNGDRYVGEFSNGCINGYGILYRDDGSRTEAFWKDNKVCYGFDISIDFGVKRIDSRS